jgi:FkbM family methyltransferase
MSDSPSAAPAQLPVVLRLEVQAQAYQIVLPHASSDYIQKKLVADRVPYEKDMLEDMRARLKPGELVLDIGANIGNHTLYLAAVAGCRIESFEPNPELCAALRESLRLNSLDGTVHVHETGLGRQAGVARFGVDMPENLGGQHLSLGEGDLRVTTLDSCSFDGPVSMLKIDVEGMELDVLEGGRALIARDRPLLYVECTNEAQFRIIARHLEPLDYTYWDTFNATPTHLFIPAERLSVEQRLQHLQAKAAQNDYRTHGQLRDARTSLNEVNLKYRTLSEQVGTLKQKVAQEEAAKAAATARVADLQAQVDAATQQLDAQLRAHQEQVTALTRDLGTQSQTARESEKLGIKSEVNLDNLRAQLEAANTKYRESTQRYAELK